jgi:CRP-like cAMP-binding protein
MPLSKRLQQLLKRLTTLEKHFLPKDGQFSLSGNYSPEQDDKTKAYLLLVHAELEAYLEDRAKNRVDVAHASWQRTGVCTSVLSRLLVYHQREFEPISTHSVTKAVNYYLEKLDKNHGVMERNLLSMFLPLGISHQDLDSRLITACTQLGRKRGQFAHASIKTHQQVDPKTERDNIRKNIIPELKKLDRRLKNLR